jgi:hypothetical protein
MMFHRWCRPEQTHATAHLPPDFEPQSNNMTQPPSLAKARGSFGLGRLGAGATVLAWLAHCSKCFQMALPPYSVNVLRIQAK